MTSRASPPRAPEPQAPPAIAFGAALQHLIAQFWSEAEANGQVRSEDDSVTALMFLFAKLAHELGRVDGVARMHGVSREATLTLMAQYFAEGKSVALQQHHDASKGCTCEASRALQEELEFN